jgi:hypothetical protein
MKYQYTAQAARWFDKVNGNTYHSVRITDNKTGETIYCPMEYGYGDHYRQTALGAMMINGWLGEKYNNQNLWYFERENDYPIKWIVTDGLKRDCVRNGKE